MSESAFLLGFLLEYASASLSAFLLESALGFLLACVWASQLAFLSEYALAFLLVYA